MFIIEFDAVAIVILGITLYVFYSQKKISDPASFRYETLLWVSLGSAFFDFISAAAINEIAKYGVVTAFLTNTIFYVFHSTIPVTVAIYVMAISGKTYRSWIAKTFFLLPYLIVISLIVTNPWTRFVFYFDETSRYRHGPGLAAPYIMVSVYIALCLYMFKTRKNAMSQLTRFALPGLFVIPGLAILLQNIFSGALLECFAIAISMLLVLFTLQNSNELIDRECGLFNRTAFIKFAGMHLENGVRFDLILLCIQNEPLLRHIYKLPRLLGLHESVATYLSEKIGRAGSVFYLEDGCFAVLMNASIPEPKTKETAIQFHQKFIEPWVLDELATDLQVRVCHLKCPDDADKLPDVFDCIEQLGTQNFNGESSSVLSTGDLNLVNRKRQAEVERVIISALGVERIHVLYQPIYSISEKKFIFADAQVILQDENQGLIQQRELFRVAEHNGIMQRLGLLSLESICAFFSASALQEKGIRHIQLRLSGVQCMQSDLSQQVLSVIGSYRIDPRHICFQITETAAVHAPDIMNINMRSLSGQNATFALDDYGSGYTDLNYIMDLPFSLIKLDKSIVHAGFNTAEGRIAMESTIALIKRLNRNIVAEGVETQEQAALLTNLGCDYLQGFYFSRPLNEVDFLKLLTA